MRFKFSERSHDGVSNNKENIVIYIIILLILIMLTHEVINIIVCINIQYY